MFEKTQRKKLRTNGQTFHVNVIIWAYPALHLPQNELQQIQSYPGEYCNILNIMCFRVFHKAVFKSSLFLEFLPPFWFSQQAQSSVIIFVPLFFW